MKTFARIIAIVCSLIASAGIAHAQTKLEARYGIWFANIPIGKGQWTIEIAPDSYTMSASGSASGLISSIIDGEGTITAHGVMRDGKPTATQYASILKRGDEKSETRMSMDNGNARDIVAPPEHADKDRVAITDAHRTGISDPLTALLVPSSDGASAQSCDRTLNIFDGRRRFDLKLSFKRMDKVKADKGYAGPAVVCATTFRPIAGHRANSALAKYLTEGRDIEIWLAPVAGTSLLVPFRLQIASMIGNMVIAATQFETSAHVAKAP